MGSDFGKAIAERISKEWERYEGPQGGEGWKNTETGEIRYQSEKPSDGDGESEDGESQGTFTEDGTRLEGVTSFDDVEEGDTVRVDGEEYDVEGKIEGPGGNDFLRVEHDGEEFTLSEDLVDDKVLGEVLETGDYGVDPDTFGAQAANSLITGEMNERGSDGFLNVRQLQHNLSNIEDEELLLDMLSHEADNRNSPTARDAIAGRVRAVGGDPSDILNDGPDPGDLPSVEESGVLNSGDELLIDPSSTGMDLPALSEPFEVEVDSIGDFNVYAETEEGEIFSFEPDELTEGASWVGGERPEDRYPGPQADGPIDELESIELETFGEDIATGGISESERESLSRVLSHASTEELESYAVDSVAEEFATTLEITDPDAAQEFRDNPEKVFDFPNQINTNVGNSESSTQIMVAALSGREDSRFELEHSVTLEDSDGSVDLDTVTDRIEKTGDQMTELNRSLAVAHTNKIASSDVGSDKTLGMWSSGTRQLEVDANGTTTSASTSAHEFCHAWQYAFGVTANSARDNTPVKDEPDKWYADFNSETELGSAMAKDLEEEWERYKARSKEHHRVESQVRGYQKTNGNEFLAVTMAHWAEDRQKLNRRHPEMTALYDEYVGGGVEKTEVDDLIGAGSDLEVDRGDRVDIELSSGEQITNAAVQEIDGDITEDPSPENVSFELGMGPDMEVYTVEDIERLEVRE